MRTGKVLHVASSNVSAEQIDQAQEIADQGSLSRFIGTQIEWSLLNRDVEAEIVPAARRNDLGVVPYFPLASGLLTGKYRKGEAFPEGSRFDKLKPLADRVVSDANFDEVERLTAFAEERGHTILELAVAWLVAQEPVTSVITGATRPEQVRAYVAAAQWQITAEDLVAIP